ncbi:hypothetical protein D3C81_1421240 [compost metagenome]
MVRVLCCSGLQIRPAALHVGDGFQGARRDGGILPIGLLEVAQVQRALRGEACFFVVQLRIQGRDLVDAGLCESWCGHETGDDGRQQHCGMAMHHRVNP